MSVIIPTMSVPIPGFGGSIGGTTGSVGTIGSIGSMGVGVGVGSVGSSGSIGTIGSIGSIGVGVGVGGANVSPQYPKPDSLIIILLTSPSSTIASACAPVPCPELSIIETAF